MSHAEAIKRQTQSRESKTRWLRDRKYREQYAQAREECILRQEIRGLAKLVYANLIVNSEV